MIARLIPLAPLIIYAVFCLLGLVRFELWSQVVSIWKSDSSPLEIISNPHGIRFLLALPIFQISRLLGVSHHWIFSITMPAIIFLVAWFSTQSVLKLNGSGSSMCRAMVFAGISIFFILLSLLMNGRLMFAMAGSSILLWTLLNWRSNNWRINFLAVLAAIILSSVSSGTFLITVFAFYLFLLITIAIDYPEVRSRKEILFYALLLVVLVPHITMLLIKILDFFGGGLNSIGNMLGHGYLLIMDRVSPIILVLGSLIALGIGFQYRKTLIKYWVVSSMVVLFLAGGFFGISTATIALPPLLVISIAVILKSLT